VTRDVEAFKRGRRIGKSETAHAFAQAAVDELEAAEDAIERAALLALLDLANRARFLDEHGIADLALARMHAAVRS